MKSLQKDALDAGGGPRYVEKTGSPLFQQISLRQMGFARSPVVRPALQTPESEQPFSRDGISTSANMNGERAQASVAAELPLDRFIQPHRIPKFPPEDQFVRLQEWEGFVETVNEHSFVARLVDKTAGHEGEEAEFEIQEVSPADRLLLQPGAIFYWTIGYLDRVSGQRTRESVIKFRRLPQWTESELAGARTRAEVLKAALELGQRA